MNTRKTSDKPTVTDADVLARAAKFIETLQETHSSIPQALRQEQQLSGESGSAAITGGDVEQLHAQLNATQEHRRADVRRRSASIEGLLELEPELTQARAVADQERSQLAAAAVAEFMGRWNSACRALAVLHAEASALSAALHVKVNCPAPYTVSMNVVSSAPELRLSLPLETQPVSLSPALAELASTTDRLDSVLSMIGGIKQARDQDQRAYQLAVLRSGSTERSGAFRVVSEFLSTVDNLPFKVGDLIDHTLVGPGHLQRLQAGKRYLQPVELESAAA